MKKYFVILLVLISIVAIFTACVSPFEMREVGGKVVTNCYGNLIPCANNTYTLGDITHLWSNIYSTNINASSVNVNGNIIVSGTVDGVDVSTIAGSSHAKLHVITSILDHSSTATPNQILKADANGLPVNATNTDAQVSSAVTNSHVQNTDWVLLNAVGGANLISSGTLKNNLAVDPGITIDGIDISTLAGGGNVSTLGGTANTMTKFTGATSIGNASVTETQVATAVTNSHAQNTDTAFVALNEPTGFANRTDSGFTFTGGVSRVLSVTTGTHYHIYFSGAEHTIAITKNITITDTEGLHLIYFDTDDALYEYVNPTTAQMLTAIKDKCIVALVYWDATNKVGVYVGEERHGTVMDGMTHYNLHYTRGLQYVDGLGLGDFVISTGASDTHAQFSVATGSLADEDLGLTVSAINSTTGLPILYRDGANGYWRTVTQAGFSVYQNPAGATNRLMYNQLTGGAWTRTEVGENEYVLCHVFMTTGKTNQIYAIMGQNVYTSVKLARDGANTEISSLQIGNLPSPEIRPLATVIFESDKDYANTINARVVEVVSGGDDYVNWLTTDLPRGTVPSDHGSLTGLSDDDHTQYLLADGTRTLVSPTISGNITMSTANALVDGVDVSAHASRHQWQGADQISINKLAMTLPLYMPMITAPAWNVQTVNGTGGGFQSTGQYYTSTGATSGSASGSCSYTNIYYGSASASQYYTWYFNCIAYSDTDLAEMWWVLADTTTTFPTTLSNHIGLKSISTVNGTPGVLSFTCSAGAAETVIQLDASFPLYDQYWIMLNLYSNPPDSVNYEVGVWYATSASGTWSLLGTATTNIPSSITLYPQLWAKNGEAVNKAAGILGMKIINTINP